MGQAETQQGRVVVLVAGGGVIVVAVGIGADLDATEGDLRAGIDIPEPGRSHEGIDIIIE